MEPTTPDADLADQIEALMAAPVSPPPAVIVVGDDDVAGFTPASRRSGGPDAVR